jgi:thiamine pyrophosphokinase
VNKEKAVCYIVAAGDWYGYKPVPQKQDMIIAVDGGYDTAKELGLTPDYVIGDFDSIQSTVVQEKTIKLNPMKDDTDTLYAIKFAKEKGYETFIVLGGTGGSRISHTVANIQTLLHFPALNIFLIDREEVLFIVSNGEIVFSKQCKGYISVFSVSDKSIGVTERGLKYEIEEYQLSNSYPIGVSNEFIGEKGYIAVKDGILLLGMPCSQLKGIEKLRKGPLEQ